MAGAKEPLCFTCGKAVSTPPRINALPSGQPCSGCSDRVLDFLPSLLPGPRSEEPSAGETEVRASVDLTPGDHYPEPPPMRA